MEFDFEVDPDLDLAIGNELCLDEAEGEFEAEDYTALGIEPTTHTVAKPGSEDKVRMLAARYAAGLPLWHEEDCCDHGPAEVAVTDHGEAEEEDDF